MRKGSGPPPGRTRIPRSGTCTAPDPEVQTRYFTAACQTVEHYHMRGVYFYQMPLNDNPAHPFTFPAYFVKDAGAKAIQGCARMFRARRHRG